MTRTKTRNSVRIIAGKLRSRRIEFPDIPDLRPTGDRIRETLFNWLQPDLEGASCLDLFAGSGALGMEAASRGARRVVLLDSHPRAIETLRNSTRLLQLEQVEVIQADALQWLRQPDSQDSAFDIVFLDPPFSQDLLSAACELLAGGGWLRPGASVYLESSTVIEPALLPEGWSIRKANKSGEVYYCLVSTG